MARTRIFLLIVLSAVIGITSCHRVQQTSNIKRYPFTGRVVSISTQDQSAVIDGNDIPGFMMPMAMSYRIKPPETLKQLSAGDSISAEVVVLQPKNKDDEPTDYWLENVKVTGHAKTPPGAPATTQRMPAPGDEVPDFVLTNQNGRQISFRQYRGKVLLVTFIYTRCPFPDFCPRMSSNFSEINGRLASDRELNSRTHLLSVSFDPQTDTPSVLRNYAYSVAHTHETALFRHWEFAVPKVSDLPKITDFFGVIYKPEGGLITHNLSTTVIGPDGKIVKWYHGGDWQVSDLMKDASDALGLKTVSANGGVATGRS